MLDLCQDIHQRGRDRWIECVLTRVGFKKTVCAPEVLRVFNHGDLGHADDHRIRTHLRGRRGVAAVGDVVERRGGVVIVADHRGRP